LPAREILLLGDPALYRQSQPVVEDEMVVIRDICDDLMDTISVFREHHGWGRAIAAPQIGVLKRIVCIHAGEQVVLINPEIELPGDETMIVWDDCMSFPELLVKVQRHVRCRVRYRDLDWTAQVLELEGDMPELIQHEVDHLDGVLTIQRALDDRSIVLRSQRGFLE
tara:strand:+ start:55 stop:555 length:501 start_codon:yes stop_codon:yes gene_type:complete